MLTAASRERVVVLASTAYDGHQLYDQRLARAMARSAEVVYVEPAVPVLGLGRRGPHPPSRRRVDGLLVLSPRMLPWGRRPGLSVVTAVWMAAAVHWACRSGPNPALIVIAAHPVTVWLLRSWRSELLLKDDYVAGAELINVPAARVARHRRSLLSLVDEVSAVSPVLAAAAPAMGARMPAHVIPPGCDPSAHRVLASDVLADVPGPRAVFIGMISDRIDVELLGAVCSTGTTVVVVGRQQTTFTATALWAPHVMSGRIRLLGEQPPEKVAGILDDCDVGLVPYVRSTFNNASFPLKLMEYLAAGLPVVSTDLPAVRWLDAPHVTVVETLDEVPAAISNALDEARDGETARRLIRFAGDHTWQVRAREHLALLGISAGAADLG